MLPSKPPHSPDRAQPRAVQHLLPTYALPTHGATCVRFAYARTPPTPFQVRLTYSVELSPRLWVPVALLEGRIAEALGDNLVAIRDHVVGGGAAVVPEG